MTDRILIYGSRTWRDPEPIRAFVASLPLGTVVVHGAQKSWDEKTRTHYGADYFADQAAREFGLQVEPHPAKWREHGDCSCRTLHGVCYAAGPRRNAEMAASDLTCARGFRMPGESRGTDDMSRRLVAAGIPLAVTTP